MISAELLVLQLVFLSVFLISLACCVALWRRFKRAPNSSHPAWLLCALAGALPLASLLILALVPSTDFKFFSLGWLLGIVAGLASLLVKLPRLATGVMAGLSTGCLCAFIGAFVLAALD